MEELKKAAPDKIYTDNRGVYDTLEEETVANCNSLDEAASLYEEGESWRWEAPPHPIKRAFIEGAMYYMAKNRKAIWVNAINTFRDQMIAFAEKQKNTFGKRSDELQITDPTNPDVVFFDGKRDAFTEIISKLSKNEIPLGEEKK